MLKTFSIVQVTIFTRH